MPGMQFPYPRKTSNPANFNPAARNPPPSRNRTLTTYLLAGVTFLVLLIWLMSGRSTTTHLPPGTPPVVIVTPLDPSMSKQHTDMVLENRKDYAARHGYATFFPNTTDYDLMPSVPRSWAMVPSLRHAMTMYSHTPWLFYLTSTALIMEAGEGLEAKVLEPRKLESLMITDRPVVPPDSVIKTFAHLRGERVDLILTQDFEGLAGGSMFVRTGEWARYFLDAWFDPLYRSYNFQKAEGHALEHIVQWHGTVLAKLALVPQRLLNSYMQKSDNGGNTEGKLACARPERG